MGPVYAISYDAFCRLDILDEPVFPVLQDVLGTVDADDACGEQDATGNRSCGGAPQEPAGHPCSAADRWILVARATLAFAANCLRGICLRVRVGFALCLP